MTNTFDSFLTEYLKAYWLRPVSALVRTLEAMELRLYDIPAAGSLELGCGDGVNSYIAKGGTLPLLFDAFRSMPLPTAEQFFSGTLDVYNSFKDDAYSNFTFAPKVLWETALDHKQALLDKAHLLNCHQRLVCHSFNAPLPLASESAKFIFSNSLYWATNREQLVKEIFRVLRPGGTCKFVIINKTFADFMTWNVLKAHEFRKYLDMGRHEHYASLLEWSVWADEFTEAGFMVDKVIPEFNRSLVHMQEFHDLREISPLTAQMTRGLSEEALREVKTKWIEYFLYLFGAMYRDGYFKTEMDEANYVIFELSRSL